MNLCECQFYECLTLFELWWILWNLFLTWKFWHLKLLVYGYRIEIMVKCIYTMIMQRYVWFFVLRTKHQYSMEKPQEKYSTPWNRDNFRYKIYTILFPGRCSQHQPFIIIILWLFHSPLTCRLVYNTTHTYPCIIIMWMHLIIISTR